MQGWHLWSVLNVLLPAYLFYSLSQLPMGRACVEHYAAMRRQCVFSNDELLLCLAEVVAGKRKMSECATFTELAAARFCSDAGDEGAAEGAGRTDFEASDLRIIHAEFALVAGREAERRRRLLPECAKSVRFPLADELADDDERICAVCQTTLFFSALACPCKTPDALRLRATNSSRPGTKRKSPAAAAETLAPKPG